jgi:serine/threonine-protein kinase
MTHPAGDTREEPRAGPDETVLADFLDEALERIHRGEPVFVGQLLASRPDLLDRGQRLLEDVRALLGGLDGIRSQTRLLRSELLALTSSEDGAAGDSTSARPQPPDPFPGEYRIRRWLGAGRFGTVWLADDLMVGRQVALKTVHAGLATGEASTHSAAAAATTALARLREEARLLGAVRHRNVVQVYTWREMATAGAGEPAHYLVLQYVPGGSLAQRVEREGPLSWQLAARYIADVAEGLLAVHARGIVHRDVKPANILWDAETDEAVLTDFGISARLADPRTAAGTPFYMSPEAFTGDFSPAQDVYALAASLFWLVTGSVPFPASTHEEIIVQAKRGLPSPDIRCADLPRSLEQLIRAGLAPDPGQRPTLPAFVTALRGSLNQLLADSLLLTPGPSRQAPVHLRLTVSHQVDRHTFVPLATTQPPPERFLRDIRRVPGEPERVGARTGDRLRIEVETDRAGYVTVFNVGPTGNLNRLYPAVAAPATVAAREPLHIVDIELTPPVGRERLFALWSRVPLALRLDQLRNLAERGEIPVTEPYRATRDMVRVQESVGRLGPEDWNATVLELNHLGAVENTR